MATKKQTVPGAMSAGNVYLVFYNVLQFLGWCMILIQTFSHVFYNGLNAAGLWKETSICLMIFQTMAWLEVVHCIVGLVRSSPVTTAVQIFSRVFVLWTIFYPFTAPKQGVSMIMMLIAWSVTEVIRYSYYFTNIINQAPYFLTYLRYTLFYVLYPMGVTGELLSIYAALPEIDRKDAFSMTFPNCINFSFSFYNFCILIMLSYIPFFPQLYFYMIGQRKKVLGTEIKKKRE